MNEPHPLAPRFGGQDPWLVGGVVLLVLLSVATVLLYRGAPQNVAEAGARTWLSVRPDDFTPRLARARQARERALVLRAQGSDSAAAAQLAVAAGYAWEARERASESAGRATATELWAGSLLDRGELLLARGSTPWWRPDDDALLSEALASVDQALATPVAPETRRRAEQLRSSLQTKLRRGPLEWVPTPR